MCIVCSIRVGDHREITQTIQEFNEKIRGCGNSNRWSASLNSDVIQLSTDNFFESDRTEINLIEGISNTLLNG